MTNVTIQSEQTGQLPISLKHRYVDALRSGKYKQCIHHLKRLYTNKECEFCLLGVLYDLVDDKRWAHSFYYTHTGEYESFTWDAWQGEKFHTELFYYIHHLMRLKLIVENDQQQKTFAELADIIEKEIPEFTGESYA